MHPTQLIRRSTASPAGRIAATTAATAATTVLLLTACSAVAEEVPNTGIDHAATSGHSEMVGATETAEAPLRLVVVDAAGRASMLDLLEGGETALGEVRAPARLITDGRYAFAVDAQGIDVLDSGAWTWDHVDHFHYYEAPPTSPGSVLGGGVATIATGMLATAGNTGIFFPGSGEAVLLDNAALSEGRIAEAMRLSVAPHAGLIAPLGSGALVSEAGFGGSAGAAASLRALDRSGSEFERIDCPEAAGVITTRIALVVGCADGAVVATSNDSGTVELEKVAYPVDAAAPATEFAGRKGRPTVAGLGTDPGVWLFDSRERAWSWIPLSERPIAAAAVDDSAGHVVALLPTGAIAVYNESGTELGRTDTLVPDTTAPGVALSVDGQRAYVNDPTSGNVFEIDYADRARLARTLSSSTAANFFAETGR